MPINKIVDGDIVVHKTKSSDMHIYNPKVSSFLEYKLHPDNPRTKVFVGSVVKEPNKVSSRKVVIDINKTSLDYIYTCKYFKGDVLKEIRISDTLVEKELDPFYSLSYFYRDSEYFIGTFGSKKELTNLLLTTNYSNIATSIVDVLEVSDVFKFNCEEYLKITFMSSHVTP